MLPGAFWWALPRWDYLCLQACRGARVRSWQSPTTGWWSAAGGAHDRLRRGDIKIIRITEFRRIGRKVRLLEIDTADDRLLVFTRWDLGTDPLDVLDALTAPATPA